MFYTNQDTPNGYQGLVEDLRDRLHRLARLAFAFLTLEDDYEPDWALPEEEQAPARPPVCAGRVRRSRHSTNVDSPWINA